MLESPEDEELERIVQFLRTCHERFEEEPPSVSLQRQQDDRELDIDASWMAYCEVPPEAFDAIVADMREGRCNELSCSIELSPFLTDTWYAPVSEPATIGLLTQGKYDHGRVAGG